MPFGGSLIVVASNYGQERPPAWWLNLAAHPRAEVLVDGQRIEISARETEGAERAMLMERGVTYNRLWAQYFSYVQRHVPVVALEPLSTPTD